MDKKINSKQTSSCCRSITPKLDAVRRIFFTLDHRWFLVCPFVSWATCKHNKFHRYLTSGNHIFSILFSRVNNYTNTVMILRDVLLVISVPWIHSDLSLTNALYQLHFCILLSMQQEILHIWYIFFGRRGLRWHYPLHC